MAKALSHKLSEHLLKLEKAYTVELTAYTLIETWKKNKNSPKLINYK